MTKMKTMKKYFHFIFLLIVLAGCKKTLQEKPVTFISPTTFFTNAASYEQAVEGIYSSLPNLYGGNSMMMREMFSDIDGSPSPLYEQALPTYQNNHQPFFYNVRGEWANDYTIVKDANFILGYLPSATIDATEKNQLIAEAEFLRGFAYFQLVQFYGDVPLRLKSIDDYSDVQIPRSPQDSVYTQILADLTFAEANLPSQAAAQGRVYKLVATALLSKVYLTMAGYPLNQTNYFQNARDEALVVINSGVFQLVSNYSQVFHNTSYTSESIWEQLFIPGIGGNPLHALSSTATGFTPIMVPDPTFITNFCAGDERKIWGINQTYKDPGGNTLAPFFQKFVDNAFTDAGQTPSAIISSYTIPFLRLGEMYLIAAEAENELNGPGGAYTYVNTIRERARVDPSNPVDVPDLAGLTQAQFRDSVYVERKRELSQEGSTWFDLKRTQTLGNIQTVRASSLAIPIGAYNNTWYIPDNEIENNNIPQNPTY
jgi:hypothetical protein